MDSIDWAYWEDQLERHHVVIDRAKGSAHPRYPGWIYPVDYGYIPETVGGDGAEVDVFVGSASTGLVGVIVTRDRQKDDQELKLLGCDRDAGPAEG
jgi:inorganic pyrophosphatase